jgi:hypothetical protein
LTLSEEVASILWAAKKMFTNFIKQLGKWHLHVDQRKFPALPFNN